MSALLNERHEAFCKEIARGANASKAYAAAGFKPCRQSASRLLKNADIRQRIDDIKSKREADIRNGKDEKTGRFLPGNSGFGGRPKGSRSLLGNQFVSDLHDEWQRSGPSALRRMAEHDPSQFVRVTASVLPREIDVAVAIDAELSIEIANFKKAWAIVSGEDTTPLIDLQANDQSLEAAESEELSELSSEE